MSIEKYLKCTNGTLRRSVSGSVNVWTLNILLIKGDYFFKGLLKSENTVLQICFGLFTHSREFVQLCYKYDIDVGLCSSGAICAAVCSHFSQVVFSQL